MARAPELGWRAVRNSTQQSAKMWIRLAAQELISQHDQDAVPQGAAAELAIYAREPDTSTEVESCECMLRWQLIARSRVAGRAAAEFAPGFLPHCTTRRAQQSALEHALSRTAGGGRNVAQAPVVGQS